MIQTALQFHHSYNRFDRECHQQSLSNGLEQPSNEQRIHDAVR